MLLALVLVAAGALATLTAAPEAHGASTLPAGFQETVVFSGLVNPTVVRFAPDGRVFVAEKSGVIKVFDSLTDTTPTVFADLQRQRLQLLGPRVCSAWRSHPNFPARPLRLRAVHLRPRARVDGSGAALGDARRVLGSLPHAARRHRRRMRRQRAAVAAAGRRQRHDRSRSRCWSRTGASSTPATPSARVEFGADGALYASGGDGASFNFVDYGQDGSPLNPCGDPPAAPGTALSPADRRGWRAAQPGPADDRRPASASTARVIRVDPATGAGAAGQPAGRQRGPERAADHRLRSAQPVPFHHPRRARTSCGWETSAGTTWEEINRISDPLARAVENFGWPCYEGAGRQSGLRRREPEHLREPVRQQPGAVTAPYYAYHHSSRVVADETLSDRQLVDRRASQFEFAAGGNSYPAEYDGALFFADYSRDCIWAMLQGRGRPAGARLRSATFVAGAANPVNLQTGPGGDLFYVDFDGGTIRRIQYRGNQPPAAVAHGDAHHRRGTADRGLRRHRLHRSRPGRHADLRLGPRRRRRVRRLHRRAADVHVHVAGHLHRDAAGDRPGTARPTRTR